jgi:hypothetical protein
VSPLGLKLDHQALPWRKIGEDFRPLRGCCRCYELHFVSSGSPTAALEFLSATKVEQLHPVLPTAKCLAAAHKLSQWHRSIQFDVFVSEFLVNGCSASKSTALVPGSTVKGVC